MTSLYYTISKLSRHFLFKFKKNKFKKILYNKIIMMEIFIEIILGFVQGITEFLPISSSGHLSIIEHYFDLNFDYQFLNVLLHCATLLAVIIFLRKKIFYLITHPLCKTNLYLVLATIPAILFVLLFNNMIDVYLKNIIFIGIGFIISGILICIASLIKAKQYKLNITSSMVMGIGQAFAVFPGISRSGTTLAVGLCTGLNKQEALEFSFLMSIPIIIASLIFELYTCDFSTAFVNINISGIIISMLVAFSSAILGLVLMQKLIKKMNLLFFVPYLIVLGISVIIIG